MLVAMVALVLQENHAACRLLAQFTAGGQRSSTIEQLRRPMSNLHADIRAGDAWDAAAPPKPAGTTPRGRGRWWEVGRARASEVKTIEQMPSAF